MNGASQRDIEIQVREASQEHREIQITPASQTIIENQL